MTRQQQIEILENQIRKILDENKRKGISLKYARNAGGEVYKKIRNPDLNKLKEIANILQCRFPDLSEGAIAHQLSITVNS